MFGSHKATSYSTKHHKCYNHKCYNHVCIHTKALQNTHIHHFGLRTLQCPVSLISMKVSQSCGVPEWKKRKFAFLVCGCHQRHVPRAMGKKTMISSNGLSDLHFLTALINLTWHCASIPGSGCSFPHIRWRKLESANVNQMKS